MWWYAYSSVYDSVYSSYQSCGDVDCDNDSGMAEEIISLQCENSSGEQELTDIWSYSTCDKTADNSYFLSYNTNLKFTTIFEATIHCIGKFLEADIVQPLKKIGYI